MSSPPSDLNPPAPAEALARIESRLERIEALLTSAAALPGQATGLAALLTDTVDERIRAAQDRGIDPDARLRDALLLLERLTAPQTVRALTGLLSLVEQAPQTLAMLGDLFDEHAATLAAQGVDLDERLRLGLRALLHLTSPEALEVLHAVLGHIPSVKTLLDSGVFDPRSIELVAGLGQALVQASAAPQRVGLLGALRALGQPEVQRALGFALAAARHIGQNLEPGGARRALAAPSATSEDAPHV